MRTVIPLRLPRFIFVFGLLIAAWSLPAQTGETDSQTKTDVLDRVATLIDERAFVPGIDFTKWPEFLKVEKPDIDQAKTDDDFQKAVNAALHKFGASHVLLMTPRASQVRRTGTTVGIGVSTMINPDGLSIVRVVKDSPAEKAGLSQGDLITEVDGKSTAAVKTLVGEEGTEVTLKVKHLDGKTSDYRIKRKKYSTIRLPELVWVDKQTADLKLYSFESGYDRELVADMVTQAQAAKNLIVDLRYNGGGSVANLQHMLGMMIPESKPLGTFVRRSMVDEYVAKTGGSTSDLAAIAQWSDHKFHPYRQSDMPFFGGHVAVLVNKFSGSASEIAAAALHDVIGAPIIGTKSAGAVLASVIVPASHGFSLQFPIEDYVTIKGVRLEGTGVIPDVEAPDPVLSQKNSKDEAVEKARAYFAQSKSS